MPVKQINCEINNIEYAKVAGEHDNMYCDATLSHLCSVKYSQNRHDVPSKNKV